MTPCRHGAIGDFKVSAHEWRCSACGVVGVWGDGWQYYGSIGCRRCHTEPAIEYVVCSDVCKDAMRIISEHKSIDAQQNAAIERVARAKTISELDRRIQALTEKRTHLKGLS